MHRRTFLIALAGGLTALSPLGISAAEAAPDLPRTAGLDAVRAALAPTGEPLEMQRHGHGGGRGGGGGRGHGGGRGRGGGWHGGGGGWRRGGGWRGPGWRGPGWGGGWGGGYRRCWINRWGERVCRWV